MRPWTVFLFFLTCSATETEFEIESDPIFKARIDSIMTEPSGDSVINYKLVKTLTSAVKNVSQTETEEAFKLYLEMANFEELFDEFSENVHSVVEKRLNDALILK